MIERLKEAVHFREQGDTYFMTIPVYAVVTMVVLILVMTIVIWSLKRRRDPEFTYREHVGIDALIPSLTGMTHGDLVDGNRIRILQNGEFFSVLLEDLRNAATSINFETYLWKKGEIARTLVDLFVSKAAEGVEVRLLVDASGGSGVNLAARRQLKKAGCKFEKYHPYRLGNLGNLNNRDHRKVVVIDGRIGYLGGHCIVDTWLGNAQDKKHFRDVSVRVEGPVLNRLQGCFSENWIEESGEILAGDRFFPKLEPVGDVSMHLAYTTAAGATSSLELLHHIAIHGASQQITIQNPYFLPDPELIGAMIDAVDRGVEVRVMLPSPDASDIPIVQHASHHHFGTMLKRGVRIFEYKKTLLHQKTMTVDHVWSSIGSTNFDDRSFELNDEVSLGVYDAGFARELEKIFEEDLKHCEERHYEEWVRRGWWHKLIDGSLYLVNEQL